MGKSVFDWYEFFAGGGMGRLGLGERWNCVFANEWCEKKAAAYRARFGVCEELTIKDVAELRTTEIPGRADLAWASFPCQDLSLAGSGAGLNGARSGTFRPFWRLVEGLLAEARAPRLVVLENVPGTLTSHGGTDFVSIVRAFVDCGYRVGALILDAIRFVPQSRPRLFIIGALASVPIPKVLIQAAASSPWHSKALQLAHERLPRPLHEAWVWWNLPIPTLHVPALASIIEEQPTGVVWHSQEQTKRLLSLMSPLNRRKVEDAKKIGTTLIGTAYKRTRPDSHGKMVQRAEVRFDNVSGCLRTPAGGSSRQTVIVVKGNSISSRLLSPREAARLMGVPDAYPLPAKYNEAYHLFGDGVVVPVVGWLERHLLRPLAICGNIGKAA